MPEKPLIPFLGDDEHLRRILIMIGYMIIAAGFAIAAVVVWPVVGWILGLLSPFLVALVVAYLFNPVVNFVQYRLRLNRIYGVVLVNLIVLLVAIIFIAIIIPILVTQVRSATVEIRQFVSERAGPWVVEQIGASETPSADLAVAVARAADEWFPNESGITAEQLTARILQLSKAEEESTDEVPDESETTDESESDEESAADPESESEQEVESDLEPESDQESDQEAESEEESQGAPARFSSDETKMLAGAIRAFYDESQSDSIDRDKLQEWLTSRSDEWSEAEGNRRLANRLEEWLDSQQLTAEGFFENAFGSEGGRSAAQSAAAGGADVIGWLVGSVVAAITWLISSVIFMAFVILLSFYLLIDFASLRGVMEVICPPKWRSRFFVVLGKMDVAVGGFIRGQLTVAVIVGLLTMLGLFLLGMKQYAVLIGVIAGVANLIPFFGPIIGGMPAVLYVLLSDSYSDERLLFLGLTVAWFVLIEMLESMVLQPYIVGHAARLHPVIVIMAVAIGAQFGLIPALLAVPATAVVRVLLKEYYWDERVESWQQDTGRKRLDERPRQSRRKRPGKAVS